MKVAIAQIAPVFLDKVATLRRVVSYIDDAAQQMSHQRLGAVGGAADHDRSRIAEPPFELPRHSGRFGDAPPFGRLPGQDRTVGTQRHYRWNRGGLRTQGHDVDPAAFADRGRAEGGAKIHAQEIRNRPPQPSVA